MGREFGFKDSSLDREGRLKTGLAGTGGGSDAAAFLEKQFTRILRMATRFSGLFTDTKRGVVARQ
jgi:hypothetical protein